MLLALLSLLLVSCGANQQKNIVGNDPWKAMQLVISSVKTPSFNNKNYPITDFGAKADGGYDNTKAFQDAIQTCSKNGGGIVLVPSGKYFTGPIQLESNVNLHLEEGA